MHIFSRQLCYGLMLSLVTTLIGCTSLRVPTQSQIAYQKQSWLQRRHALSQINQWDIDGAFSIRQPNKNTMAAYEWQQKDKNYHIRIFSSLDVYGINITGRPGGVMLWRSSQQRFTARTPEQLMQQQLGWRLPLSNLFYWMRGLPALGNYQAAFDDYGHLTSLRQNGWQVHYTHYVSVGAVDLPQVLELFNTEFAVKIVIKHWRI